ncbi:hypothetical protein B9T62_37015 [Paenibacillus donghaensis]|uniref:Glycosyltransferase RgtA/B/C/D-like domain-containing protein n=2 Tax=Paenibacillus donghaensis TaxID=414771 RepID=A0A2Z2KHV5_9BACL|nr:hypothetical protein B9T62_37015 [Paenibacillus donghaensis]
MSAAGIYWAVANTSWTLAGTTAAAACFGIFVWLGVRTIPVLTAYIAGADPADKLPEGHAAGTRERTWLTIILWMLGTRALLFLIAYGLMVIHNGSAGSLLATVRETWHLTGIDTQSYLGIAEHGYVTEGDSRFHIVFLPLFPKLIQFVQLFTGDYLSAGFAVSNLCAIAAALVAYELALLDMTRKDALRVVKYIFIFPSAFFFVIPMTESLFLVLSLMSIYFVRRHKWLLACLCAALAGYTRSPGILLAVPIAVEMARVLAVSYRQTTRREWTRKAAIAVACLAVAPLGLLAYLYVNYAVTGNPFQFSIYQREHWFQRMYLFWDTARYQTDYVVKAFREGDSRSLLGLWLPNVLMIVSTLLLICRSARKLHPSYTAYFIVYFAYVVGPTWLLSAPRYFAVAFPLAFAAVLVTKDRAKDAALTVIYLIGGLLYLALFVWGYPIY